MNPTISLTMIARDEAHIIASCIESVREIISEIVLVDTGSNDGTPEIVKQYGAKILTRPWDGDFSAPRNLGIENSTGVWILVLDADEVISKVDLAKIPKLIKDPTKCYELTQRHYTNDHRISDYRPVSGEFPELEKEYRGFFESSLVRLFPRHPKLRYQGRIHELMEHSIVNLGQHTIVRSGIRLHHYGHTDEIKARKNKHNIYGPLGETKISENPTDWKGFFELGVEYNCNGKLEESVGAFKKSISLLSNYLPTWINLGYVLCELGRYEESIESLITALKLDPKSSEARCNLGVVYLRTRQFGHAEICFREATAINPTYVNAYMNLARVLASVTRLSEAAHTLNKVLDISPTNAHAKSELGALYILGGDLVTAKEFLNQALECDPNLQDAKLNLEKLKELGV